jgi:hypothetical protein
MLTISLQYSLGMFVVKLYLYGILLYLPGGSKKNYVDLSQICRCVDQDLNLGCLKHRVGIETIFQCLITISQHNLPTTFIYI